MPPVGRPPLARGVYSYEDAARPCPVEALVDTSFIVEAVIKTQPGHQASQAYLARLLAAGTTLYFNRLLEMELAETAFQIALREQYGSKRWKQARYDGRARRRAGRLMEQAQDAWEDVLTYFPYV